MPNLENRKWLYLWMTWHTKSGLKVYINSKLIKTNRFGRKINPRSRFSSEIMFAGGSRRTTQTTHASTNQTFTLSTMQLFGKQMNDAEVGKTMLYFWNESKSWFWSLNLSIRICRGQSKNIQWTCSVNHLFYHERSDLPERVYELGEVKYVWTSQQVFLTVFVAFSGILFAELITSQEAKLSCKKLEIRKMVLNFRNV